MRRLVRRVVLAPFYLWAAWYVLVWRIQTSLVGRAIAFSEQSQALAGKGGLHGKLLRLCFYRMSLRRCGKVVNFGYGTILSERDAEIAENVYIGAYCTLGLVTIGAGTLLGSNVDLPSGGRRHRFDRLDVPIQSQGAEITRVVVGADCWLGNGALVMANVGDQSVIGAGSVVTKEIPPRSIAVGSPARVVRARGFEATA